MSSSHILLKNIFAHHLMEKLCLIFLNHPWEESLLPRGHNAGVRKMGSRVQATSKDPHTAFFYGVHVTETTEQPFTDMLLIICIFLLYFVVFL